MSGPVRERLAVVRGGGRQGSGYLLTPTLVLTAAHLVAGADEVRVTALAGHGEVGCHVSGRWYDNRSGTDVAVLVAPRPLTDQSAFQRGRPNLWAMLSSSLAPVPGCQAIGFPYAQRDATGGLDTEQLTGTYKPGSGLLGGRDVLAVDGTPPAPRPDGVSPWAGMSGAAVFAGDVLIGVVTTDPHGWQHGRVTVTLLQRPYDGTSLRSILSELGFTPLFVPPPGRLTDPRSTFEARYASYLVKRHGTLKIYGIDLTDHRRAIWPLDAAYYSLEAAPTPRHGTAEPSDSSLGLRPHPPLPAEQALAGHDRVLLRGVAGSGKTTLVQWLAVATARQELSEHLEHLRGLVPYVLPLRTIARRDRLPAPADFLSAVETPLTPPPGWAEQVLTERRALVLIDGLDEIDERARERVGEWLRGLLAAYPGNRWLVTSRPSAVADSWLADEGFTELTLSPMSRGDIRAFTERWHDAARAAAPDDPDERARLDAYQRTLVDALHTKQDLARLATNPLMCGLICALHRDRSGYLPTGRKELYDAALGMLLIRRDRERDLATPLTEAPQIQLLQKLAYWLVKNGQAEMDRADALALISAALPAMPSAAALGDAPDVYRYLLERSGLLREPTAGTVDFIHRTFQDYLAARAAVEDLDFDLLTANAHHDQWADVIRMAVAHGRPYERARLLSKLIERGDTDTDSGARLHLLAMASLEHATELDPQVRAAVQERAELLIPPQTSGDAEALASVGPLVLELLPGPEGLSEAEVSAVVTTARLIGGDTAVPLLARYAAEGSPQMDLVLTFFPPTVDPDLYAREVVSQFTERGVPCLASSREELTALARLSGFQRLELLGIGLAECLDLLASFPALSRLTLYSEDADPIDLAPLAALPALTKVIVLTSGPVLNADRIPHVKVSVRSPE